MRVRKRNGRMPQSSFDVVAVKEEETLPNSTYQTKFNSERREKKEDLM